MDEYMDYAFYLNLVGYKGKRRRGGRRRGRGFYLNLVGYKERKQMKVVLLSSSFI